MQPSVVFHVLFRALVILSIAISVPSAYAAPAAGKGPMAMLANGFGNSGLTNALGHANSNSVFGSLDSQAGELLSSTNLDETVNVTLDGLAESPALEVVEPVIEPVVEEVVDRVAEVTEPVVDSLVDPVDQAVAPVTEELIEPVVEVVKPVVAEVIAPVVDVVQPAVEEVVDPVVAVVEPLVETAVDPVTEVVVPVAEELIDPMVEVVEPVVGDVIDLVTAVVEPVAEEVIAPVIEVVEPVTVLVAGVIEPVIELVEPVIGLSLQGPLNSESTVGLESSGAGVDGQQPDFMALSTAAKLESQNSIDDSLRDGASDKRDSCSNTQAGQVVLANGCKPLIAEAGNIRQDQL